MEDRWNLLCDGLKINQTVKEEWWKFISVKYNEPSRFYHTFFHLQEMFEYRDKFLTKLTDVSSVDLSIWFHDVIYNPTATSGKNEDSSAEAFETFAEQAELPENQTKLVFGWIVATKHHKSKSSDSLDFRLFMDMDMAVIGKPWIAYLTYTKQVRSEYQHLPLWKWVIGRSMFINSTLNTRAIFSTKEFNDAIEIQARSNLKRELTSLQGMLSEAFLLPNWIAYILISVLMTNVKAALLYIFFNSCFVMALIFFFGFYFFKSILCVFCINLFSLFWCLFGSEVIHHPFPVCEKENHTVVQAGSFNPPHKGHFELLKYLSARFKKVYVVIGVNATKEYAVSANDRKCLVETVCQNLKLENIEVFVWSDYIWRFLAAKGANSLVRGIRSWRKDGIDEKLLEFTNIIGPLLIGGIKPFSTIYMMSNPEYANISSSLIRKSIKERKNIENYVDDSIVEEVKKLYDEEKEKLPEG